MHKLEKIRRLTSGKDRQLVLTLNYELVELFKEACKKNNTRLTAKIESCMIEYIEENGLISFE